MPFLLAAWLAGCAAPALAPDRVLAGDPMLAALPPDVTVIAALDVAALRDAPIAARALAASGVDRASLDEAIRAAGGPRTDALERVVVACGDAGCAALAEGDFADFDAANEPYAGPVKTWRAPGALPGLDGAGPNGERYALRVLSGRKTILGDRAAVRAVRDARGAGLDAARLEGDVPDGDAWIAAWDMDRLVDQGARRAARSGVKDVQTRLATALARSPVPLDDIAVVALAVSVGEGAEARLRVRCHDDAAAIALATAFEAAALREDAAVVVTRVGARVEAAAEMDADALLARLGAK